MGWRRGGSLRVVIKEGVNDRVGEDGVFVVDIKTDHLVGNTLGSLLDEMCSNHLIGNTLGSLLYNLC